MKTTISVPDDLRFFIDFANAQLNNAEASDFAGLVPVFERLACRARPCAEELLLAELAELHERPHYHAEGWDTNQLLLEVNKNFSLGISLLQATPAHLLNAVADAAYIVLGTAPFSYSLYKMPADMDRNVFRADLEPRFHASRTVLPGQMLQLQAGIDIIDWRVEEPVMLLRLIAAPSERVQWVYQKHPVRPWFIASVDPGVTQLSALSAYFADARYVPALGALEELLRHPSHQVRWESAGALWKIDRDTGLAALRQLLDDPHPHVHRAAARTYARLGASLTHGA